MFPIREKAEHRLCMILIMSTNQTLSSLSHLSAQLHVSVAEVLRAADVADIRPSVYIDSRPLYDQDAEQQIRQALARQREGKSR